MNWLLYFLVTVMAVFIAISIYGWLKAEWDERQRRKSWCGRMGKSGQRVWK